MLHEIGGRAMDRLRGEEVVNGRVDRGADSVPGVVDDLGTFLQDETAGFLRVSAVKRFEMVAHSSAHVDEDYVCIAGGGEELLSGVEVREGRAVVGGGGHDLTEDQFCAGMLLKPGPEIFVVAEVPVRHGGFGGVGVVEASEPGREGCEDRAEDVVDDVGAAGDFGVGAEFVAEGGESVGA